MKRTPLRRVSKKRAVENRQYAKLRAEFLELEENIACPVVARGLTGKPLGIWERTTQIHHKKRRYGKLLNDRQYWLAVSAEGHAWIEAHPNQARKLSWLI